jgi:hypothetical protein
MAAAFFLLFTNPKSNPWLFLALLNIAGSLFCLLYHAAGMIGARAALRWRDYILAIEDDKSPLDYPLHWFYDPSKLEQKKQTHKCFLKPLGFESNILPLQIAWIVTPFIFECGWVAASGYLVWRGNLLAFAIPSLVVSGAILLFIICRTLNLLMTGKISMRL